MTFSIWITLIFLIYCVVWLQLPGMLWSSLLLPHRLRFSSRLMAGFFMGVVYMAILYYIESMTGLTGIIMVAGPLTSVIALIVYLKKGRPSLLNASESFNWIYVIIFVAIYIFSFFNFQAKYLFAFSGTTTQVYHDYLFHTGNIVSLSRSFPNTDIRVSGLEFYYHYFYELVFAMCKHIFGMSAFGVYTNGNALICAFPLTMALITIGERLKGTKACSNQRYFFYCTGLLVSCICLLPLNVAGGTLPVSWMDNHFFGNANAMGLAMALTILIIDVLSDIWYDKCNLRLFFGIFVLAIAATGFKGTTGVMLVAIGWVVFVIEWIITKKFHLQQLLYDVAFTLGFVLTYALVTVGLESSGSNNRATTITPEGTLAAGRIGQIFTKLGIDYMAFPAVVIAVLLTVICIMGPCIVPFIGFTIEKFDVLIKQKIIGNIFDWFAIGTVIMGVIGFCFVSVPGLSQGYFVITGAGLLFYCAVRYYIEKRESIMSKILTGFFILGTLFLVVDILYYCHDDVAQLSVYHSDAGDRADLVSSDTIGAYLWLRDNTPEDSLIAVDRLSEELDYRSIYFYASAFSERQCYLEGYDYSDVTESQVDAMLSINEKFYSENAREAEAAMELNGVDYLVVTSLGHPDYQPVSTKLKLVYTNDEVSIYKYLKKGTNNAVLVN